MQIKRLRLRNFRNYDDIRIDFAQAFNIIHGNNAQGKTNIIEAIFLCASGRSHRTSKDIELLKYGADSFDIELLYESEGEQEEITINYCMEERKKIKINEIPVKKIGDLMGHLNAVIFSPEDLMLVKQGPAERRRFADITLSQLRPSYFYDLQQYARILYQRNTLLKSIVVKRELVSTLDIWDRNLARTGTRIMKARTGFVNKLDGFARVRHNKLTNGEERLNLQYSPSFEYKVGSDDVDVENKFMDLLERNRGKEIQRGTTVIGPHRDDISIVLNEESTKIYGSQGQQRTAVLSMKLAEIDLMKEESGEYPVLLLDDVLSELDDRRKEYLLETIKNVQAFITCTDRRFFQRSKEAAAFFYVKGGNIMNEKE